jgi:hypothetical protein
MIAIQLLRSFKYGIFHSTSTNRTGFAESKANNISPTRESNCGLNIAGSFFFKITLRRGPDKDKDELPYSTSFRQAHVVRKRIQVGKALQISIQFADLSTDLRSLRF